MVSQQEYYKNAYRDHIIGESPLGYWRFGDNGTVAIDQMGNYNGTYVLGNSNQNGSSLLGTDIENGSWFNNDNAISYIDVGAAILSKTNNSQAYTFEAWVKLESINNISEGDNSGGVIFGQVAVEGNPTQRNIIRISKSFGQEYLQFVQQSSTQSIISQSDIVLATGSIYHIAVVKKSDKTITIYINGVQNGTIGTHDSVFGSINGSKGNTSIGGILTGNAQEEDNFQFGTLDEVAIYNYALSSEQLRKHYLLGLVGFGLSDLFDFPVESPYLEYEILHGGKWFYAQNQPGTKWYDNVSNSKGWTIDFNMRLLDIENNDMILSTISKPSGLELYINDGTISEQVSFLPQEVVLNNSNLSTTFDTTQKVDYRLLGKEQNIQLYAKPDGHVEYSLLLDSKAFKNATNEGNGYKPSVFVDKENNIHTVWHDDGNKGGQIYYAKYSNKQWSKPELIVNSNFGVTNTDIVVDENMNIYVVYESKETDKTSIAFIHKSELGWGKSSFVSPSPGFSLKPKIILDSQNNINLVWEDDRLGIPEIFYTRLDKSIMKWKDEIVLTTSSYGALRPSISSYLDNIFISWTDKQENGASIIKILLYNSFSQQIINSKVVSNGSSINQPDFSCILANVRGDIFVVWHDHINDKFDIYTRILTPLLDFKTGTELVTNSNGDAKYPVLSEHLNTGNVFYVWTDLSNSFDPTPDADSVYLINKFPSFGYRNLFIAPYDILKRNLFSSGSGENDIILLFNDERYINFPATPVFFDGDLPIIYESLLRKDEDFLNTEELFSEIRHASYDASNFVDEEVYISPYNTILTDVDNKINGINNRKEIRFGDFSNTLNIDVTFGNLKFYTQDAVKPLIITEVNKNTASINELVALDAVVSDNKDVWSVGPCGVLLYIDKKNVIYIVDDKETAKISAPGGIVRNVVFDKNNNLYIGGPFGVYYSINHYDGFIKLNDIDEDVTSMAFDKNNKLFLGTSNAGIKIITIEEGLNSDNNQVLNIINTSEINDKLPSLFITSFAIDDNNVVWVGTKNGLVRYFNGNLLTFNISNGLSSNLVNDIAIRNSSIRYIATSNGISKMLGTTFKIMTSQDGELWNDNVKSVAWRDPNILWAGTMSSLNQIIIDDEEGTLNTIIYNQNQYSSFIDSYDDFRTFYIVVEDSEIINEDSHIEIFLNGNRISHGYIISGSPINIIRFDTSLKPEDVVDITVRNDIKLLTSFAQSTREKRELGSNIIRLKNIDINDDNILAVVEGEENEIKINDIKTEIPFDRIHFDQTPPTGKIEIVEHIEKSVVKVRISNVKDLDALGADKGSGVDSMIISNFPNFTIDGVVEQSSEDLLFEDTHDLGIVSGTVVSQMNFSKGKGNVIVLLSTGELFAGTSKPAILYKYDNVNAIWEEVYSFPNDRYIDFITEYNNNLIVSIGSDDDIAKLYVFKRDGNNINFSSFSVFSFEESRAFSFQELNAILYVGTGIGTGNEYVEGVGSGGRLWSFDGSVLEIIVSNLDLEINGLSIIDDKIIAVTGSNGFIYEINIFDKSAFIVYTDRQSLLSIDNHNFNDKEIIFVGTSIDSKVLRSDTDSYSFFVSFQTVPGRINRIKSFVDNEGNNILYIVAGDIIYFLADTGTWTWKYSHYEEINDITFDPINKSIYVISNNNITKIDPLTQNKTIYLQLIDRAGNKSILFNSDGSINEDLSDSISISSLEGFVNENKILELDEDGNVVFSLSGTNNFYSGDKIDEEKGVYESEIFDGSNDIIKWDIFSWQATELDNTEVLTYIRTSSSRTDILLKDWVGPFDISQASGVDISFLTGQYIQFKADLISTEKEISPLFHKASIRVVTSESVHFFTTNFVLPSKIRKGILTSQKIIPIAADIIFGINTTNSVDFSDYQVIDENRLFDINQNGENLRIGVKFISPSRSLLEPVEVDEYGPYNSNIYLNTIDFNYTNNSGDVRDYFFRITLFEDFALRNPIFTTSSDISQDGFNIGGLTAESGGIELSEDEDVRVLFTVPGSSNIVCNTFYFVKVEAFYQRSGIEIVDIVSEDFTFIATCSTSFIDFIEFNFTNDSSSSKNYHFRIKFYSDAERTNEFLTLFSGNDTSGWNVDGTTLPDDGIEINVGNTVSVLLNTDNELFEPQTVYYLTIDAFDGNSFVFASNFYTFQARDILSLVYCGEYDDVPILSNFGLMFELDENQFVTLNSSASTALEIS